jgi:hypothetical protein
VQVLDDAAAQLQALQLVAAGGQELAGIFGGGLARNAVAWQQYVDGILERSSEYAAGMQGVIQSPNWAVTRAYYYYVRMCLAIPG